ncbi:hypothetical protein [Mycobacterium hubeiense]|uniref:hypothetical protein n=1 Tax=Mycobacterium hubeiense TaxID=1867256 RepID=UPI001E3AB041|nr:hypothetical protein [Mycobacterium sp. QGD 101]
MTRRFIGRLAGLIALALAPIALIATPQAGSNPCQVLWVWNPATNECRPPPPPPPATTGRPPPPPAWFTQPPPWAPPWAPPNLPPPPPKPAWANPDMQPVWDPGHRQWGIWVGAAWVPV